MPRAAAHNVMGDLGQPSRIKEFRGSQKGCVLIVLIHISMF